MPTGSSHLTMTMAGSTLLGGCIGLARGSGRSFVASSLVAGAFAWAGHCINTDQQLRGFRFATVTSALLAGAMTPRFVRTKSLVPGLLAASGVASALYHGYKWQEWA
jgi:uncharacterized membrane protein (UPF0136 family)